MIVRSLDSEWTGKDLRHGSAAFLVTFGNMVGDAPGSNVFYEWDVDPFTREVDVPESDLEEIQSLIDGADVLVLQNAKSDYTALQNTLFKGSLRWDWDKVHDTLIEAHVLGSNQPKDLTTLALVRNSINIQPHERALEKAVKDARRYVETKAFIAKHGEWRIARKGEDDMPSAKETVWKADYWLPRAVCKAENRERADPWWTVCSIYANWDSTVVLPVHQVQEMMLKKRGLWKHYLERRKLIVVGYDMEEHGPTINKAKTSMLLKKYENGSQAAEKRCMEIAKARGHELVMPKGGRNKNLEKFFFDVLKLPIQNWTDGGSPSMDSDSIDGWLATLDEQSEEWEFLNELKGKRSRDTACTFLRSYERFWKPTGILNSKGQQLWYRLHPNLNQTGTDTLRWSSNNPNEQNISKKENFNLRSCFGPAPGREWWSLDARNIELRLPAYVAGEKEMIRLFETPQEPPYFGSYHLLIFDTLHPEKFAKHGKDCKTIYESTWYQWTKNGNFAVQYGAQEYSGTADAAYHVPGAQHRIQSRFTAISQLNLRMIQFAEKHGYVETIPDKTVDPNKGYPLLCTRSDRGRIKPTVPLSYYVQGSAMWWMGKAKRRVWEFFQYLNNGGVFAGQKWPGGYYIALQVHDELVPDCPSGRGKGANPWEYNTPVIREVKRLMELGGDDFGIPTPVSCEYNEVSWDTGKELAI